MANKITVAKTKCRFAEIETTWEVMMGYTSVVKYNSGTTMSQYYGYNLATAQAGHKDWVKHCSRPHETEDEVKKLPIKISIVALMKILYKVMAKSSIQTELDKANPCLLNIKIDRFVLAGHCKYDLANKEVVEISDFWYYIVRQYKDMANEKRLAKNSNLADTVQI